MDLTLHGKDPFDLIVCVEIIIQLLLNRPVFHCLAVIDFPLKRVPYFHWSLNVTSPCSLVLLVIDQHSCLTCLCNVLVQVLYHDDRVDFLTRTCTRSWAFRRRLCQSTMTVHYSSRVRWCVVHLFDFDFGWGNSRFLFNDLHLFGPVGVVGL